MNPSTYDDLEQKVDNFELIELKTPLPTAQYNVERRQDSVEHINDSDVGKKENQVDEAIKSNDESEDRLEL